LRTPGVGDESGSPFRYPSPSKEVEIMGLRWLKLSGEVH